MTRRFVVDLNRDLQAAGLSLAAGRHILSERGFGQLQQAAPADAFSVVSEESDPFVAPLDEVAAAPAEEAAAVDGEDPAPRRRARRSPEPE